ncbi:MAG: branched-chain amino acid ABC transporter permease [Actinobacteria bacterium]|nr:branched-chain amino acid ABC transporter permease [Actinomycetota bacterium]MSY15024.1 branched-chain amino acid ABC transporter permease [Actinomycetota bacterium]
MNRATAAQSLSVSLTVGAYGIAFGAASIAAGFSVIQSCLLSLLTFTGASQFAVVGVLGAGGSALSGIATASLLGVRNTLYGLRMAPLLQVKGLRRIFAAQITIDESTGVALSQEHLGVKEARQGFWLTGIGVFIFWNIFTLAGALGAQAMGNPAAWGLDAAVPAAFLGLLWPRLVNKTDRLLAASACVLALAMTPYFVPGVPIISTAFLALAFGLRANLWR